MRAVVFENQSSPQCPYNMRVALFWNGRMWSPVQVVTANVWLETGQAYLWPDRAAAEAAKFIPPAPIAVPDADGWIAVGDRLPPKWQWCLVTDGVVRVCRGLGTEGDWLDHENGEYPMLDSEHVTHWQPLPALPALPKLPEVPR